jgi:hypothetical protein
LRPRKPRELAHFVTPPEHERNTQRHIIHAPIRPPRARQLRQISEGLRAPP